MAASHGHGKEAHEQRSGPPIQVQVNALIFWQLLYVHYAAHDRSFWVVCVCSSQIEIFNMYKLCDKDCCPSLTHMVRFCMVRHNWKWAMTSELVCH